MAAIDNSSSQHFQVPANHRNTGTPYEGRLTTTIKQQPSATIKVYSSYVEDKVDEQEEETTPDETNFSK